MKLSTRIGTILTMLMFLLVLSAIVIFLLQGRRDLLNQRANLEVTRAGLNRSLDQREMALATAESAQADQSGALATASVDIFTLETIRDNLQTERDDLNATVATVATDLGLAATAASDLLQQQRDLRAQPPLIQLINPTAGAQVAPGVPLPIVVVATDAFGLSAVNITINGETVLAYNAADETLVTVTYEWRPSVEEVATISVMAIDVDGHASAALTLEVEVVDFIARNEALQAEIESNVAELRGLAPRQPVPTFQISAADLQRVVVQEFLGEDAAAALAEQVLVYAAFNFMPRDFDLLAFERSLYGAVIAGFYDSNVNELVLVSDTGEYGPAEELTIAHEYMHALQDQYFRIDELNAAVGDGDQARALRALAEGEAQLLTGLYNSAYLTPEEATAAAESGSPPPVAGAAAQFVERTLSFPYNAGGTFAQALYTTDGFAGLNAAWTLPPVSTEQILHPERYRDEDLPIPVPLPPLTGTLGAGWRAVAEDVMGEFMVRQFLSQQLNEAQVDVAATGWGGDRFAVYYHEANDELVLLWRLVWDTADDLNEFNIGFFTYANNQYGPDSLETVGDDSCWQGPIDVMCLFSAEESTVVVRAPDVTAAQAIALVADGAVE